MSSFTLTKRHTSRHKEPSHRHQQFTNWKMDHSSIDMLPATLTQFQTKIWDFITAYPIARPGSREHENIPCFILKELRMTYGQFPTKKWCQIPKWYPFGLPNLYSFNMGLPHLWVSITICLPHSQALTQFQCQDEQNGGHAANKGTCLSLSKLAGGNTRAACLSCLSQVLLHLFHPLLLLQPEQ